MRTITEVTMKRSLFGLSGAAILIAMVLLPLVVMVAAPGRAQAQDPWVARPTTVLSKVDRCSTNWDSLSTGAGPFTLILANYGASTQILYAALEDSTGTTHQLRVVQGEPRLVLENIRASKVKMKGSAAFLRGIYVIKR
jgi:hypothetical protein